MDEWVWSNLWNDTDRRKLKYLDRNLPYCHIIHNKPHTEFRGTEPSPQLWDVNDLPPDLWHNPQTVPSDIKIYSGHETGQ